MWGQGRQRLGVAQHGVGLPEGADQVLALGQVHPGLAADGRVDLRQQLLATLMYAVPRWKLAAANPATSVTIPPPTAMTTSAGDRPEAAKRRASISTVASVLDSSPSGTRQTSKGSPGVQAVEPAGCANRLLGHDGRHLGPGRHASGPPRDADRDP